ncbi:hypothetical protein Gogos_006368, partial [Gossypium gossypioides]|nr:hypothetical protein [Gossypium gossypioides]
MTIARTWAFNDGDYMPLQTSPGSYNEDVFKILEEKENKYVQWAKQRGQDLENEDDFYTNSLVKEYYKNHVKAVLTRNNTITGVLYKDDPTIFAWELINEPHCPTGPSGARF